MAAPKKSKDKFAVRALRGTRAARTLADDTLGRMAQGFSKILDGSYDTKMLLQDVMAQTSDVVDAFRDFMGGSDSPPQVILIVDGGTVPVKEPTLLSDNVKGATLKRTMLTGVSDAGAAATIPDASWDVVKLDESAIGGADDVEQVLVRLKVAPPADGTYRATLMSGKTKVLAEVLVVSRP
jgi:hypothetical protein